MSAFNDEIDLDVLQYALQNHADRIPATELQTLLHYLQAFQQQEPGAAEKLCQFAMQSEAIDLAYDLALTELRHQYQTQQPAKGTILTAQHQGQLNGFNQVTNNLILQLETILNPTANRSRTTTGDNFDRIAIMGAGGAFLGAAIVQFLGGGASQFIGAAIGLIFGIANDPTCRRPTTHPPSLPSRCRHLQPAANGPTRSDRPQLGESDAIIIIHER